MKNIENLNDLSTEVKILIVTGQTLVDETRKQVKEKFVDLTSKLQLRDDCAAVEKLIKKLQKGKFKQKDIDNLRLAIVRLQTTSGEILKKER